MWCWVPLYGLNTILQLLFETMNRWLRHLKKILGFSDTWIFWELILWLHFHVEFSLFNPYFPNTSYSYPLECSWTPRCFLIFITSSYFLNWNCVSLRQPYRQYLIWELLKDILLSFLSKTTLSIRYCRNYLSEQ